MKRADQNFHSSPFILANMKQDSNVGHLYICNFDLYKATDADIKISEWTQAVH